MQQHTNNIYNVEKQPVQKSRKPEKHTNKAIPKGLAPNFVFLCWKQFELFVFLFLLDASLIHISPYLTASSSLTHIASFTSDQRDRPLRNRRTQSRHSLSAIISARRRAVAVAARPMDSGSEGEPSPHLPRLETRAGRQQYHSSSKTAESTEARGTHRDIFHRAAAGAHVKSSKARRRAPPARSMYDSAGDDRREDAMVLLRWLHAQLARPELTGILFSFC